MRRGTKRKASRKDEAGKSKEETKKQQNNEIAEEDEKEPSQSQPAIEENSKADANDNSAKDEENKVETSSKQAQEKPSKALKQRAKRAKILKPEAEPEYFEDQRNMEDLWKQTFPVGTEWEQLDLVYQYNWSFRNLEDAFEEGGELYGKRVYLFGCTEPQFLSFKDEQKVIVIPVVVAVVSPFPPSDKLGITSVQRESEEIVPMKQMKMDWVPYIPLENRESQVERLKSQIFILGCTQRRAGLRHLKEDRVKKFQYCLPYFYQPFKEDELEQSTEVQILYPDTEPPTVCSFDWELDEYEEFIDKLIEEEVLPSDSPDVSSVKSPFINRYYGKAHKVL